MPTDWNALLRDVVTEVKNAEQWRSEEAARLSALAAADKCARASEAATRQALKEYADITGNKHDYHVGSGEARLGGDGHNVTHSRPRRRRRMINISRLLGFLFWVCIWFSPVLIYFYLLCISGG